MHAGGGHVCGIISPPPQRALPCNLEGRKTGFVTRRYVTSTDSRGSLRIKTISQHGRPAMGRNMFIFANDKPSAATVKMTADVGTHEM